MRVHACVQACKRAPALSPCSAHAGASGQYHSTQSCMASNACAHSTGAGTMLAERACEGTESQQDYNTGLAHKHPIPHHHRFLACMGCGGVGCGGSLPDAASNSGASAHVLQPRAPLPGPCAYLTPQHWGSPASPAEAQGAMGAGSPQQPGGAMLSCKLHHARPLSGVWWLLLLPLPGKTGCAVFLWSEQREGWGKVVVLR